MCQGFLDSVWWICCGYALDLRTKSNDIEDKELILVWTLERESTLRPVCWWLSYDCCLSLPRVPHSSFYNRRKELVTRKTGWDSYLNYNVYSYLIIPYTLGITVADRVIFLLTGFPPNVRSWALCPNPSLGPSLWAGTESGPQTNLFNIGVFRVPIGTLD